MSSSIFRTGFATATDGVHLYWRSIGTGPTLVCCNGVGVSIFFWKYLVEHYAHRFQIRAPYPNNDQSAEGWEYAKVHNGSNGYFTFPRVATKDTEVGGTRILKGMVVRPSPLSPNYDPDVFPHPLRFDIHRKPKRILSFGAGPHHKS